MKKFLNVVGIVLATLFSLLLIPLLILNPIFSGLTNLLQPEVIEDLATQLIEEVDLTEISLDHPELLQALTEAGISPDAAQALLSSRAVQEAVSIVGGDFALVLQGHFTASALTEEEVLRIVNENLPELVQLARLLRPSETALLTDEQLTAGIVPLVQENLIPMLGELDQMMSDLQSQLRGDLAVAMELLTGPIVRNILLASIALLAVLIFLCRWPHQQGLLWLGIDSALAALPVLSTALSLKGPQLSQLLAQGTGVPNVFGPVLRQAGNTIFIGGLILAAAAVVLIAGFILLRDRRLKKQAAQSECVPVSPSPAPMLAQDAAPAEVPANNVERSPWDNV